MKQQYSKTFMIADLVIEIQCNQLFEVTKSFEPFVTETNSMYMLNIQETEHLDIPQGERKYEKCSFTVIKDENDNFYRLFYDFNKTIPYAVAKYEWEQKKIFVHYVAEGRKCFRESGSCFAHAAWEEILKNEQRSIFHAACVETSCGGILFAGESGSGKSTQADLWCKYGKGRLINGDRPILRWIKNDLYAYGSPYAGSSKCYLNEKCEVGAIVFVKQSENNHVRSLGMSEAFRRCYASLTIHSWDVEFVKFACDFAEKIVEEIPVYELECTKTKEAVETLEQFLKQSE